ncbi:uroporphyrinogen-III synthase [Chitinophaga sp. CCNWLY40]|uniref:uroporphyrinogen-III synthase n=1 Tax=Chitinophaga sp. CCNWLW40 TaxID=3122070 RepID=UPI0030101C06
MLNDKYRILSTRHLTDSSVAVAGESGIHIDVQDFIQIKPVTLPSLKGNKPGWNDTCISDIFQAPNVSVFTSANALKVLKQHYFGVNGLRNDLRTIFLTDNARIGCISGKTLQKAREIFPDAEILASSPYGSELAAALIALGTINEVNFYCGSQRRHELPDALKQAGITVHEYVIYENIPAPAVTADDYDGVLFFSPSAVKSYLSANRLNSKTVCFAIGRTTATELREHTDNKIIMSTDISEESMVQTAIFYFNNINCYE